MAACNHASSALFLISLILFAAANPLAHGQLIPGLTRTLRVSGSLCCTPTGLCLTGSQPVAGAPVRLNCTRQGNIVTLGTTTTGVNGQFTITATNLTGIVNPLIPILIPCIVTVNLPLNATICPVLSTVNGTIVGVIGGTLSLVPIIVTTVFGFFPITISI